MIVMAMMTMMMTIYCSFLTRSVGYRDSLFAAKSATDRSDVDGVLSAGHRKTTYRSFSVLVWREGTVRCRCSRDVVYPHTTVVRIAVLVPAEGKRLCIPPRQTNIDRRLRICLNRWES